MTTLQEKHSTFDYVEKQINRYNYVTHFVCERPKLLLDRKNNPTKYEYDLVWYLNELDKL